MAQATAHAYPQLPHARIYPNHAHLATEVLAEAGHSGKAADRILGATLREQRRLGGRDRRIVRELVFFSLKYRGWLAFLANPTTDTPEATPANRLIGAALATAGRLDTVLAEQLSLDAGFADQIQQNMRIGTQNRPGYARYNLGPLNLTLFSQFPRGLRSRINEALLARAPVDIRFRHRQGSAVTAFLHHLDQQRISHEPIEGLPQARRIYHNPNLTQHKSFKQGLFDIQDAGSQWICELLDVRANHRVLDSCAGAGGKSLNLADRTQKPLLAADVDPQRLARLTIRADRMRVGGIKTLSHDGAARPTPASFGTFDRILIDAPCSGSGTWRRHPEGRFINPDIPSLQQLQYNLLSNMAERLAPGGLLMYATCSLWQEENEQIVERFLTEHPQWQLAPIAEHQPVPSGCDRSGMLRLRPDTHGCDGFFAARLMRRPV